MNNISSGLLDTLPEEFTNILSEQYNLFFYRKNNEYIIYISQSEIDFK
tara:strand:- start:157 stop:300 length:144 start_codon:yes stop_codon:yes gene_type:complete